MNTRRLLAVAALSVAAATSTGAQIVTTGPFTVPGGSTAGQIAQVAENNWRLGATFACNAVGSELEVIGIA